MLNILQNLSGTFEVPEQMLKHADHVPVNEIVLLLTQCNIVLCQNE
jgi:hypothetical protein